MQRRSSILSAALLAIVLPAGAALAQGAPTVVNQSITEAEVLGAQKAWCEALVTISRTGETQGQAAAKALPRRSSMQPTATRWAWCSSSRR